MLSEDARVAIALWALAAVLWAWTGLIGAWTAAGRGHVAGRVLVGIAPTGALWSIGAFELIPLYLAQWAATAAAVLLWRRLQRRKATQNKVTEPALASTRERPTFSLGGLLLVIAVFAMLWRAFANWPEPTLLVGTATGVSVVSMYVAISRQWLMARLTVWVICMTLGWIAFRAYFEIVARKNVLLSAFDNKPVDVLAASPIVIALLTSGILMVLKCLGMLPIFAQSPLRPRLEESKLRSAGFRTFLRTALVILSVVMVVPPIAAYFAILTSAPIPRFPPLAINGYHALLRIGQAITPGPDVGVAQQSIAQLRSHVELNSRRVAEARDTLEKPCRVIVEYKDFTGLDNPMFDEPGHLRNISHAFSAAAILADREGNYSEAASHLLDTFRLGHALQREGTMVHFLVGSAIIQVPEIGLVALHAKLGRDEKEAVAQALRRISETAPGVEGCLAVERAWQDRANGWRGPLDRKLNNWLNGDYNATMIQTSQQKHRTTLQSLIERYETNP